MLIQISILIFATLLNFNIIFTAPEINIHTPHKIRKSSELFLEINDYDYFRKGLKEDEVITYKMRGEISEDYKKGINLEIISYDNKSTSFETNGEFKTIDIYIDEYGEIIPYQTKIIR